MRFLALIPVMLFVVSGCASTRPVPTTSEMWRKRQEIETLQEEINVCLRRLEQLQQEPPAPSRQPYTITQQAQNLDRTITILRSARERLSKDVKRVEVLTGGNICQ